MKNIFSYIAIQAILNVLGITILTPTAALAGEPPDFALDITSYFGTSEQSVFLSADANKIPSPPVFTGWNASWQDLLITGAMEQQFAGHKLAIRLGFIRGNFDTYTQTYKAEPVAFLYDLTDDLVYPYLRAGSEKNCKGGTLDIWIKFSGKTVEIRNNKNVSEQAAFQFSDLLAKWTTFASSYCSTYFDAKYCLVPQRLWDGMNHYGYVTSTSFPLYHTTNLPQDYVELYKEENGNTNFKPIAHSLPIRFAFVLSPDQKYLWGLRTMTAAEVGDAMIDRSKHQASANNLSQGTSGAQK